MLQMNHVPYNLTPGHLSKSDKNITTQTKENELPAIGKSCVTSGQQLTSSISGLHDRSTTTTLINKPKVRVYFRRIVYSGLFIGMYLLSEMTPMHLFNSLG